MIDPRYYQLLILAFLLVIGEMYLSFGVAFTDVLLLAVTCLASQFIYTRLLGLPRFEPWSALITAMGLSILLRTTGPEWLALAAMVAISSKFLIRINNKHVFNPANIALVLAMLTETGWVAFGQWGSALWLAGLVACLGVLVLSRARRSDITLAFLAAYGGILYGRAWWLGDAWSIPWHQVQNGALLLFAFFMISDPRTIPDARPMRILYAGLVASFGAWIQFGLYMPEGLLYALAFLSPLVPLMDRFWPGERFVWQRQQVKEAPADGLPNSVLSAVNA